MLRISLYLPACCITVKDLFFFQNYSLCILDSKVRDDKIRAGEMNQIKHSYNIIGLYTEFCYSKTGCRLGCNSSASGFAKAQKRLQMKGEEKKRGRQNIGQAGGVELGSDASGLHVRGI